MKILVIASEFPPGKSVYAQYMYELSNALGAKSDVKILTTKPKDCKSFDAGTELSIARTGGKRFKVTSALAFNREAARLCAGEKYDHVITALWHEAGPVGHNLKKKTGVPFSVILFDNEVRRYLGRASMLSQMKTVLDSAANAFCVSKYSKSLVAKLKYPAGKLPVIGAGGDHGLNAPDESVRLRSRLKIENNYPLIYSSGDLEEKNAFDILLWASFFMHKKNEKFNLIIRGSGKEEEKLNFIIKDLKMEEFAFILNPEDAGSGLCEECDIYVKLGRGRKYREVEAVNLDLLSASYGGKPVVAAESGGLPEFVNNKKTGYIVPALSPKDTAEALSEMLNSSKKREQTGGAGREFIEENYTWAKVADRVLNKVTI